MSIDILKEDIRNKKIRSLYLFYGPEEYLKKHYVESIENVLLEADMKAMNRVVLEGKTDVRRISDNCETMPVFAEKKVVIVRNSGLFKSGKKLDEGSGKGKGKADEFTGYLQGVPEYTCLIFYEAEIDKRMKAVDAIKKNGLLVEFPFQKPADLVKWVVKAFKTSKKEIDTVAASLLVEGSEQGMTDIFNEIGKLLAFTGDKLKVTAQDVENVCTKSVKSRIFDLTDAIADKNVSRALKLLNDMIVMKEPVPRIQYMITRQFRHLLHMKLLRGKGVNADDAASKIGITPYAAYKLQKQIASFPLDKLKDAIEQSLIMDTSVKTGKIDERMAVELLICRLAQ